MVVYLEKPPTSYVLQSNVLAANVKTYFSLFRKSGPHVSSTNRKSSNTYYFSLQIWYIML